MNLILVDTGSVYYQILNTVAPGKKQLPKDYEAHIRFNVLYLLSGCYIRELGYTDEFQIVFLNDVKPYWRHAVLEQHGTNYKGNRHKQPWRDEIVSKIKSCFDSTLRELGINSCAMWCSQRINGKLVGYEADDLASGIIQIFHKHYDNIFVMTVDTDWLPFTENRKVTWLNTAWQIPRVRRYEETLDYCRNSNETTKTVARRDFMWFEPTDLWSFKAEFGDSSDNIRGNRLQQSPGFFEPYIDLYNPLSDFRCWKETNFIGIVNQCLTKPRQPLTLNQVKSANKGCSIAIEPYQAIFSPTVIIETRQEWLDRLSDDQVEQLATDARASLGI